MRVLLAGYNLDAEIIQQLKDRADWKEDNLTPETLSAAYARISRDPKDIDMLRAEARLEVEKARKSNDTIIFGLGHASVAEHAYFNFDVIGLSRLATEEVQKFRLASFTEKSQRYITLEDDFVIPQEILGSEHEVKFVEIIRLQNSSYHQFYQQLKDYLFEKHADLIQTKNGERMVDGWAKEDARYIVSLATESQFGMSVNARSLENMLKSFNSSHLKEVRDLGAFIFEAVHKLSPSIIKYTTPTKYDGLNNNLLKEKISSFGKLTDNKKISLPVNLVDAPLDGDMDILGTIIACVENISLSEAKIVAKKLSFQDQKELMKSALENRQFFDSVSAYFEMVDFTFELSISASNYAQLKRHRMSTQITTDYDLDLGVTIPPNIVDIGLEEQFRAVLGKTEALYSELKKSLPNVADYVLTNAHHRRVIFKANLRELYHFVSLRLDAHAQWDIQKTACLIKDFISEKSPLAGMMLCGKDQFCVTAEKVFGKQ